MLRCSRCRDRDDVLERVGDHPQSSLSRWRYAATVPASSGSAHAATVTSTKATSHTQPLRSAARSEAEKPAASPNAEQFYSLTQDRRWRRVLQQVVEHAREGPELLVLAKGVDGHLLGTTLEL